MSISVHLLGPTTLPCITPLLQELPDDEVRLLLELQLSSKEPIRPSWYRANTTRVPARKRATKRSPPGKAVLVKVRASLSCCCCRSALGVRLPETAP